VRATLEGLESSWDSPGLGQVIGSFESFPRVGMRFVFNAEYRPASITTGHVKRTRKLGDDMIGFQTNRTTYILKTGGA